MPKIDPVNENERTWIKSQLESASKFVESFSPASSDEPRTLGSLDRAFAAWIASEPSDTNLINAVINHVGVAFGQALVDGIGLRWVIAMDENGSDLAVHGLPNQGDVLIYPVNFVAKRWERRIDNFLEDAYLRILNDIGGVRRQWQYCSPN
jgi:hypothetical protein